MKQRSSTRSRPELDPLFLARIPKIFGASFAAEVKRTFVARPCTFRVNTLKTTSDAVLAQLAREGFKVQRVPWSRDAYVLANRSQRELQKTALYSEGQIYLQSLASQVPPLVLAPLPGERVLDMTAAPGSKTSQIAALMKGQGELCAVELNKIRAQKLEHNLRLLGVQEAFGERLKILCMDATKLAGRSEYQGYFDRILLDAPCSGEARFITTESDTFSHWNEDFVRQCASEQSALVTAALPLLKPGGTLVYSTCTFSPEENEFILDSLPTGKAIAWDLPGLRTVPALKQWRDKSFSALSVAAKRIYPTPQIEGFFLAKMRF